MDITTESASLSGATEAQPTTSSQPTGLDALSAKASTTGSTVENVSEDAAPVPAPAKVDVYSPDFKYKVMGEEKEIDEWLRPAIKDKEVEKKVKELYEKAYGLDSIKPRHQELKAQYDELRLKSSGMDKALKSLGESIKEKDYDTVFSAMPIPKEDIISYALELVRREQNPELKAQFESSRQAREKIRQYEAENARLMESHQELALKQRSFDLERTLDEPEVKAIADVYNSGVGDANAFRQYVIQIGQYHAAKGNDISVEQAVGEALKHLKAMNVGIQQRQQPTSNVVQPSAKPTIPSVTGRSASAVRPAFKSLDDVRRKLKELDSTYGH